eukprot:TRINITY_DN1468_c0_g2_i1.p1 TRINITY_DN1468_c0_g2~~TRINITY_DN1468_c0_g2_i1.p1  ORF type:complete len:701 (-),score=122.73 TRINITY_DN1468_c0_g2_i1:156-2258(-)
MGHHGLHKAGGKSWEKHYEMPVKGVRSIAQMDRLTKKLQSTTSISNRLQYLVYEMKVSPQVFSGDQVLSLAPYFPDANLVLALHLFDHHLLGFKCDQAARLISLISVPEQRLEALQVIDENLLDPVNRFSLRNLFPPYLLAQVDTILREAKGQALIYGAMRSNRVIFLVDKSGSMKTEFKTECGERFNRLEFVVHDLHKLLCHRVNPDFYFNIIAFNSTIHRWKNSLHRASDSNLNSAERWLDHLEADGGTNFSDPLRAALQDEDADTIYLLSDGEPNEDTRDIIFNLKTWIKKRKNPVTVNTIAFLMGHHTNDPIPRRFLISIAEAGGGVFRCLDPFHHDHEHVGDNYQNDCILQNDDDFIKFFNNKLSDVPQSVLDCCDLDHKDGESDHDMMTSSSTSPQMPMSMPMGASGQSSANPGPLMALPSTPDFFSLLKKRPRTQDEISIASFSQEMNYFVFNIQLSLKQVAPNKDCAWIVSHRYNDFKNLHKSLTHKLRSANIATLSSLNLPPATFFLGLPDRPFLEKRRSDLEKYLKLLYVYVSPYEFPEFDMFLLLDLHVNQAIQQATIEMKTSMMYQPPSIVPSLPPPNQPTTMVDSSANMGYQPMSQPPMSQPPQMLNNSNVVYAAPTNYSNFTQTLGYQQQQPVQTSYVGVGVDAFNYAPQQQNMGMSDNNNNAPYSNVAPYPVYNYQPSAPPPPTY